jgi:murein DD-endopeptidase MepM/ murein hydrolase activator NlpD
MGIRSFTVLFFCCISAIFAFNFPDTALDPQENLGPNIFYPDNPEDRLFKIPLDSGTVCSISAGPFNRNCLWHGHYQWDFMVPWGTPVIAARAGKVTLVDDYKVHLQNVDMFDGSFVITYQSYTHVNGDGPVVGVGQELEQGDLVCYTGQVGMFDHLHYEVTQVNHGVLLSNGTFTTTIPIPFCEVIEQPPGVTYKKDGIPWGETIYVSKNVARSSSRGRPVSINKPSGSITAYPNPFSKELTLGFKSPGDMDTQGFRVGIYSSNGACLFNTSLSGTGKTTWQSMGSHASGTYIVRILAGQREFVKPVTLIK